MDEFRLIAELLACFNAMRLTRIRHLPQQLLVALLIERRRVCDLVLDLPRCADASEMPIDGLDLALPTFRFASAYDGCDALMGLVDD